MTGNQACKEQIGLKKYNMEKKQSYQDKFIFPYSFLPFLHKSAKRENYQKQDRDPESAARGNGNNKAASW